MDRGLVQVGQRRFRTFYRSGLKPCFVRRNPNAVEATILSVRITATCRYGTGFAMTRSIIW